MMCAFFFKDTLKRGPLHSSKDTVVDRQAKHAFISAVVTSGIRARLRKSGQ